MARIWMSHITGLEWTNHVTVWMGDIWCIEESYHIYQLCVWQHVGQREMSHVSHMNESRHRYEHEHLKTCLRQATRGSHLCKSSWKSIGILIYRWDSFLRVMSRVLLSNQSCLTHHTYQWVMSHISLIWMSHVSHNNVGCHTHEQYLSHGTKGPVAQGFGV